MVFNILFQKEYEKTLFEKCFCSVVRPNFPKRKGLRMLGFHPGDPGSNPGRSTTNSWWKALEYNLPR